MKPALLAALAACATLALGQPGDRFGHGHRAFDQQLDLSTEQRDQVFQLRTVAQSQAIDLRADVQKLRLKLQGQLRADKPGIRAINGTIDEIAAKRAGIVKLRVNQRLQVRALLTPEQRRLFDVRPFRLPDHGIDGHRQLDHRRGR